jgi:hypothetical protein
MARVIVLGSNFAGMTAAIAVKRQAGRRLGRWNRRCIAATAFVFLAGSLLPTSTARGQQAASQDTATDRASTVTLRTGGLMQMRYAANRREPLAAENEWTSGFQVTRVRLILDASYSDRAGLVVRAGVDGGGSFNIERAFADLHFGTTQLRMGQFYLPGAGELYPDPERALATDYSPAGFTFDVGATQGVMAVFRPGRWRAAAALHSGLRSGFAQAGAGGRADAAATVYLERNLIGDTWSAFAQSSSLRGSPPALKVGLAATYQSGGNTGDTDSLKVLYVSADVDVKGSGWNALGQFMYQRSEPGEGFGVESGQTFGDMGFVVQGGVFVTQNLEIFLRYDQVIPDGKERDPAVSNGTGTHEFRTLTGGLSLFVLPGRPSARFSVDYQYMFDAQTTSIVPAALNAGVFPSTGQQSTLRAQFVASF